MLINQMPTIGIKPTMKYISDYLFLHPEYKEIIDTKQLGEILKHSLNRKEKNYGIKI